MTTITLENLAQSYLKSPSKADEDWALKETNFTFRHGGAYALLGPSGCGKTTLLNIISGLVVPTRGRLKFGDRDVTHASTVSRNISQVFQFPVVYDTMTVGENLAFPLRNRGVAADKIKQRVGQIAELLDLTAVLDKKARNLTPDARQKISLGRGLVRSDVSAILFDEPLTVIDPALKWELRSTLKAVHRELDVTMVYVTHDQTEALTFADTVVVMSDGRVLQSGNAEELYERPAHTFVGNFIGSPGMNFVPAKVSGRSADIAGTAIALPHTYAAMSDAVELGVRPNYARLAEAGSGIPARLIRIEDLGRMRLARVRIADRTLSVTVPDGMTPESETAGVIFDTPRINVYSGGRLVAPDGA
ncbi:trehalose import ATP-binding protein SugC [Variibacter gotjawalensis]|uniref:Trehalose import ATP-binding protein SugC n=1 Tax=Variibacter gotjawalensis TaxID=1333996 RepID=A0A0S3Q025_9BRAD|nr:ABC transporter ATP-binding protein [Variibacter gotjawalensis]NIK47347.1 glycerol transport system ATP-binding protein [Variibacter gotjawalensis]RZS49245.1 carbohydrate ABC transporter ATP-binding protein (CUT1 family) [Variibacter gotjawalensis]BAT61507.1 trehalose import ATP-binding protein SugC [Variibacter gotjawalensis]